MSCTPEPAENLQRAMECVREATSKGAQVICLPELFQTQYFCQREDAALFDLAASIPGPTTQKLSALAKELKIDQNVKFLGFVVDARRYLKAFDIALLTSRKEGMPYFVLECLQAGLPILASHVGGIPEIVRDGENGLLFQSGNLEDLTAKLVRLCKDQELRVNLSKNTSPDNFEVMLRETFALYRS